MMMTTPNRSLSIKTSHLMTTSIKASISLPQTDTECVCVCVCNSSKVVLDDDAVAYEFQRGMLFFCQIIRGMAAQLRIILDRLIGH